MENFQQFLESECVTNILYGIIAVIVFVWFIWPMVNEQELTEENFADIVESKMNEIKVNEQKIDAKLAEQGIDVPYVKDGTIMSGSKFLTPTFENSSDVPDVNTIPANSYLLDDGNQGKTGLHTAKCSKSCCSQQWPVPFKLKYETDTCGAESNFVANNYTCNNAWNDSGCLCMTKPQFDNLSDRGGNAGLTGYGQ